MAFQVRASSVGNAVSLLKGDLSVLDTQLAALYLQHQSAAGDSLARSSSPASEAAAALAGVRHFTNALVTDASGRQYVVVDVTAKDGDTASLLQSLTGLGLTQGSAFGNLVSGLLPVDQIGGLLSIHGIATAHESAMASSAGKVTSQAVEALYTDTATATYGVTGAGLRIGVLSDSFNTSGSVGIDGNPDTVATNIASGDLPAGTKILQDSGNGSDEGRAMAQLIHDIAPDAGISFATAFTGQAGFANNILRLANTNSKVIVDDIIYFFEPAYQDGVIAQAVNQVAASGVNYFSSAGNNGFEGYESKFYDGGYDKRFSGNLMEFAPGQNALSFVASEYPDIFILQWDQPAISAGGSKGSASDLDLYVTDESGDTVFAFSAYDNIGDDPSEGLEFQGDPGKTYYLRVALYDGEAPNLLKLVALGNGSGVDLATTDRNINTGTTYGHAAAQGASAVAAAYYLETPRFGTDPALPEYYTSNGPVRIAFDTEGNRLAQVEVRQTPAFTGVDGTNTTFFGFDTRGDADKYPNFFGTSAAAPNAAAVALLMLQARAALTPEDVRALLKDSASDMDDPATPGFDVGVDNATGTGLINAALAVKYATTLVIDNAAAPQLFGTSLGDTILGGSGATAIAAGAGNDRVNGGGGNDVLTGGTGSDSFVFNSAGSSGRDRITDFGKSDAIVTDQAVRDANNDGVITFKGNVLLLDRSAAGDSVTFDGVTGATGLRALGSANGLFYYADASVRPTAAKNQLVIEGTVGNDTFGAPKAGKTQAFFFDNNGAAPTGADKIASFGNGDILVTTKAIADSNGDGIVVAGPDGTYALGDGESVMVASGGRAVTRLELDGTVNHNGVDYFVYSLVGSAAGASALHF